MENPSIMSHVSLGTNDFAKASDFYDAVLSTLGGHRIIEHADAIGYGKQFPEFWLTTPFDDGPAQTANGTHFAFWAESKDMVDAFYAAALSKGANGDGRPGPREEYGKPYYGCFVRDPDGHKIEATYWDMELAKELGMG